MKKKVLAIAAAASALALSVCMLTACSSSSSSASASGSASTSGSASAPTQKFIVGFDAEYPPYGYIANDGSYTGFDIELAQEVSARNGWEFEAQPIDWDAKDALIESENVTCIWNGFTMEGREDSYAFSEPYMLNSQVILVKADSAIAAEADLAGKTVLTQADSAALDVLEGDKADLNASFAGGAVTQIGDYTNALMQLESGAVDALACDYSIAAYAMAQNEGTFKVALELSSEHYAVGFKTTNQALADQVTATLKEMAADGTVAKLIAKYADQGIEAANWCLGELK